MRLLTPFGRSYHLENMSASPEVPKPIKKVPLWHLLPFSVFVLSNCALVALYHDRLVEAYEQMSPWTFVIDRNEKLG